MRNEATILLVEDDEFMLDGMSDLLHVVDIGYDLTVLTASDGKEGLDVMSKSLPDIIVSDIMMPRMDGFQFLEAVRQNPAWLHVPFIFLTARGNDHEIHKGKVSGANLYITKPFQTDELRELIKTQLDRTFQLRAKREQSLKVLKKDILQILNHEFRTPLTYVTAYYDMLADSLAQLEDNSLFQEYLRGIQVGCIRLTRLIEDFILVIELRTGDAQAKIENQAEPIYNVADLIHEAVYISKNKINESIDIIYENIDKSLPTLYGHWDTLLAAFVRLIDNAIKFTLPTESETPIRIKAEFDANALHIFIQDQGIGFPEQAKTAIFELFYQHNRGLMEQQGAGTGLVIAKGLIELHQGCIKVTSEENKGSTFTAVLPIYKAGHEISPPPSCDQRLTATVLIVEDDPHLMLGLQELLNVFDDKYKFNILTATSGEPGLAILAENKPNLIISDIMMPGMDGYAFLKHVRENQEWLEIPFIFLTARGQQRDVFEGLRSGAEQYITKPYDSEQLMDLVNTQLDRHFALQGSVAKDFDSLKRGILDLITPDFRHPLSNVTRFSQSFAQSLEGIETDIALKQSLHGIQESSINLTHLVEDFISLAELKTGEAEVAFGLQRQTINNLSLLVCELKDYCQQADSLYNVTIDCVQNEQDIRLFVASTYLLEALCRLVDSCLQQYAPDNRPHTIQVSTTQVAQEAHISLTFDTPLSTNNFTLLQESLHEEIDISLMPTLPSLKIVQGYIGLHDGHIAFTNTTTNGFIATITLPIS